MNYQKSNSNELHKYWNTAIVVALSIGTCLVFASPTDALNISGTSNVSQSNVGTTIPQSNTGFRFIDRRGDEKTRDRSIDDQKEGVTTLNDSCIGPSVAEYLRLWLVDTFPEQLSGTTVVLKQLTITTVDVPIPVNTDVNIQAPMVAPAKVLAGSVLGKTLVAATAKMIGRTKINVSIIGSIDGVEVSGGGSSLFVGRVTEEKIKKAIDAAATEAFTDLNLGRISAHSIDSTDR